MIGNGSPLLCGILVHWHDESRAAAVVDAWGHDSRFELLVIDNGSDEPLQLGSARLVRSRSNLGYAGAVNLGLRQTRASLILMLNTDCRPEPGALEQIIDGFESHPDASGLVPRLVGPDGRSQHRWQLRPLPSFWQLALQACMIPVWTGPKQPPAASTTVEQPAAAALALRRQDLEAVGGMDDRFHPAWFEDVDLAARMKAQGKTFIYWPSSTFVHDLGSSVATLGYGLFLWVHYRNLYRYLHKHYGSLWADLTRVLMVPAALVRIILLPLCKPSRATSKGEAFRGLRDHLLGILSRWRRPRPYVTRFRQQEAEHEVET